jgi:multiple sugar transport system permease protein
MRSARKSARPGEIAGLVLLFIGAASMVLPFLWMISTSLKTYNEAFQVRPRLSPRSPVEQLLEVLSSVSFAGFYFNRIVTTTPSRWAAGHCSMGAYAFARLHFKGRDNVLRHLPSTLMGPAQVTMIPHLHHRQVAGLDRSTFKALIMTSFFSAYGTFLLRQFYLSIPSELEEAVRIDGGGAYRCFLPDHPAVTKPAMATLGHLCIPVLLEQLSVAAAGLQHHGMFTLPMGIQLFSGRFTSQWHLMMAASHDGDAPIDSSSTCSRSSTLWQGIAITGLKA